MQLSFARRGAGGDDAWVVCKFSTFSSRQMVCMKLPTDELPYACKTAVWQEWDGRDWRPAPSLKCRPSWHGWGLDKLDSTRLKFSPGSPGGAF